MAENFVFKQTGAELQAIIDGVETIDQTPTAGSKNPVESGGVAAALEGVETALQGVDDALDGVDGRLDGVDARLDDVDTALAGKQTTLVSGTNIKTINGESVLGSGDLRVGDANAVKNLAGSGSAYTTVIKAGNSDSMTAEVCMVDASAKVQAAGGSVEVNASGVALQAGNSGAPNAKVTYNGQEVAVSAQVAAVSVVANAAAPQATTYTKTEVDAALAWKADKVTGAVSGDFAGLDANGNLVDSGKKASDFATAEQGTKADAAAPQATTYTKQEVDAALAGKQATLVSGENIKTINNTSLLGGGNINIPKGEDGADAVNPFKGWFADVAALRAKYASPAVGDFAYVKGAIAADPAAIYECTTAGTWADSGRTADTSEVQTFATGEQVNETGIDDEPMTGSENLVRSGAVADCLEVIVPQQLTALSTHYYLNTQGNLVAFGSGTVYRLDVAGMKRVRIACTAPNNLPAWAKYAFYDTAEESEFVNAHTLKIVTPYSGAYDELSDVPSGAVTLLVSGLYSYVPTVKEDYLAKVSDSVRFTEAQNKTDEEKAQARANIGIPTIDTEVTVTAPGIPTTKAVADIFTAEDAKVLTLLQDPKCYLASDGNLTAYDGSFRAYKLAVTPGQKLRIALTPGGNTNSSRYAFYNTSVESEIGSGTLVSIGERLVGAYDVDEIVPNGAVLLLVIGLATSTLSVSEYVMKSIPELAEDKQGKMSVYVDAANGIIATGTKYDSTRDLLIRFEKCMFNELMTFYRVGLSANTDANADPNPQREITTILNATGSDNIGPICLAGLTVGGNHSLNNDGVTKTAKTDSYSVFVDGKEVSQFQGYGKVVVIKVVNTLFDPTSAVVDNMLTVPAIEETVVYRIENGDISVICNHRYYQDLRVSYYYGMQSMFQFAEVLTGKGAYPDWTANVADFNKEDHPEFDAFICKNANGYQTAWLDTNYGLGRHEYISDSEMIFHRNGSKLYHCLILGNRSVTAGANLQWRGVYSWKAPISEASGYLNMRACRCGEDWLYIALKTAYSGIVESDPSLTGLLKSEDVVDSAAGVIVSESAPTAIEVRIGD